LFQFVDAGLAVQTTPFFVIVTELGTSVVTRAALDVVFGLLGLVVVDGLGVGGREVLVVTFFVLSFLCLLDAMFDFFIFFFT
jgi:hypothetical protein